MPSRRPHCSHCGTAILERLTAVEVRGPTPPAVTFVLCAKCAEMLRQWAGRQSKALPIEDPDLPRGA